MKKFASVMKAIWITVVIWMISLFVPGFISAFAPNDPDILDAVLIIMLPLAWAVARKIAKNKHSTCIKSNFCIFATIKGIEMIFTAAQLVYGIRQIGGRYYSDIYGVPYSDYPNVYGKVIIYQAIYIALCLFLIKKTVVKKQTEDFSLVTENS